MSNETEAKLLVVEDEPNIRELLATSLRYAGFDVATAASGAEALRVAAEHEPDLCVLDVMLPDMDGFTVTRRLREQGRQLPIVFVTARDSVDDKIKGLTVGGDDYVTKPFSLEEVVARIRAVLRRTRGDADEDRVVLTFEDLELDEDSHEVRRAGRVIETSPTEFKLLRYLLLNPNRVLSKSQILDHVWDYDFRGESGIVESYISYLRRKIDTEGLPPLIHTKRGVGYVLKTPARVVMAVVSAPHATVVRRLEAVPLRRRLVAIVGVLVGAALVLTSLVTAYLMYVNLTDRVDAELQSVARPVAAQAFDDLRTRDTTFPSNYAFELQSRFGTVLRLPTGVESSPDLPDLDVDDPRVSGEPFTVPSEDGRVRWRFVAGRVVGDEAVFAVGVPLDTVTQTVTRLLVTTGLIGTLVLILSLVLARYAVHRAFRPLSRIEDTAAAIAAGDLTQRVPVRQADDEVTSLSRSLNTMLSRIESSFAVRERSEERMRQFVADASHELRTPLATVRGYAELYRQGAVSDPTDVGSAMERIEAESGRMSGLVEDLLTLARLDDAPEVEVGVVDLTVLAADAVADARVRAPDRRISLLGVDGPLGPTVVCGSEPRLRQVVTNLVANALRHTPEGTPVELALGIDSDGAVLEVRDHGPGVPADVATKVFERFYRADPARGRASGGGSGLGLAIVAAIVAAHHGQVGVADTAGGGATFVVRLPQETPSQ